MSITGTGDRSEFKDTVIVVVVFNYLLVTQRLSGQNQHRAWATVIEALVPTTVSLLC